ncbi:hypothetical protein [Streptomyces sp. NPDC057939]|uniref:hypothetical protein n=1 Tax=Streptomyces sp. NPDC057939 TaxID=3346284 RepID=UPI0036E8F5EE
MNQSLGSRHDPTNADGFLPHGRDLPDPWEPQEPSPPTSPSDRPDGCPDRAAVHPAHRDVPGRSMPVRITITGTGIL